MSRVGFRSAGARAAGLTGLLVALAAPLSGWAGPDPLGAAGSLVRGPLRVAGDVTGGVGLCLASGVALVSDGVSFIDANRVTRPLLRGVFSRGGYYAALGISHASTGMLELLRGEDIERLPEHRATYLQAAPGYGRWTTFATGLSALYLGVGDGLATLPLVVLYAIGAEGWATRLEQSRDEQRTRALGPLTPEPPSDAGSKPGHRAHAK